jgi:hypothetical protein
MAVLADEAVGREADVGISRKFRFSWSWSVLLL